MLYVLNEKCLNQTLTLLVNIRRNSYICVLIYRIMKANEKKLVKFTKKVEDMTPMERYRYGVAKAKEKMGDKWVDPPKFDAQRLIKILDKLEQNPNFIRDLHDSKSINISGENN